MRGRQPANARWGALPVVRATVGYGRVLAFSLPADVSVDVSSSRQGRGLERLLLSTNSPQIRFEEKYLALKRVDPPLHLAGMQTKGSGQARCNTKNPFPVARWVYQKSIG